MATNPDFRDLFAALNESGASYLLIGGYAVAFHGRPRHTKDLDLLVDFDDAPTLFGFIRLENELSQLLGVKVDLVMKKGLKPALGERILSEAVAI